MKHCSLIALLCIGLCAGGALAEDLQSHPLASRSAAPSLDLFSPQWLRWGPTTLSYSQAWSGHQSYSQGFLLKDFSARLAPHLNFRASFGIGFSPSHSLAGGSNQPQLVLPHAALTWQPSRHFLLKLEYSQMGSTPLGYTPYGRPYSYGSALESLGELEDLEP